MGKHPVELYYDECRALAEASKPRLWTISSAIGYTLIFVTFRQAKGSGKRTFSANLRNAVSPFF